LQRSAGCALIAVFIAAGTTQRGAQALRDPAGAPAPLVHLPADQANHPAVNNEWWYVVGHLHAGARTFGYEVTTFRLASVQPPGVPVPVTVYRTDVAITDEVAHRFHHQVTYYFPDSAKLSAKVLGVHVGRVALTGATPASMQVTAPLPGGSVQLRLSSQRAPMYVGGRGYIPFGGGYTYYYSLTDLASHGRLTIGGRTYSVSGISWLDHQWGNWNWRSLRGWTWMALQLGNGVQLSVFDVRGASTRVREASVLMVNGTLRTLPDARIRSLSSWVSPHTGGRYPSRWIVSIPSLHATLHVDPTVTDQEVAVPGQKAGSYWEGSGRVTGAFQGRTVSGLSYTELTGYAASFIG
jgi:predicted secreted hydrolase